ncbi:hypothetical protein [uncultured Sphaerochaeta sp.]|uniref:hypothetical protein n=1 Tax=uncultured Sphaerochaeta sp. TaxID=886478 RepID=UPI002A0A341D|nr:hypothetical protein [uncultured Sphaerochaeta sp.]
MYSYFLLTMCFCNQKTRAIMAMFTAAREETLLINQYDQGIIISANDCGNSEIVDYPDNFQEKDSLQTRKNYSIPA